MALYEMAVHERTKLMEEIRKLDDEIAKAPAGHLHCYKCKTHFKWYLYPEGGKGRRSYLPKSRRNLAERLAKKRYCEMRRQNLQREATQLGKYIDLYRPPSADETHLLREGCGFRELLLPQMSEAWRNIDVWKKQEYRTNPKHREKCVIVTADGTRVRSKSEAMIATALSSAKLSYRYECELVIEDRTIFPDFTILHSKTGRLYIWEHLGMMDDPEYADRAFSKLCLYIQNGYFPGDNLLLTYESKQHPLDYRQVMNTIETALF